MIVTCERCTTQFQLDDSRIPPGGVRVRCSRCKHAFEIALPAQESAEPPPGDTLPDLPPDVAEEELWGSADDLDRPAPADAAPAESAHFAQRSALSEPASAGLPHEDELAPPDDESSLLDDGPAEEEESDWEFNEEPPEAAAAPAEVPREAEGAGEAADVVDQFLRSPRSTPSALEAAADEVAADEPSGLDLAEARGAVASLREPPPEPAAGPAPEPAEEPVLDRGRSEAASGGPGDELGGVDDWDLFGGESERPSVRTPAVRLPAPVVAEDEPIARPRWAEWTARAGGLVGWTAVGLLFALGLSGALPASSGDPARVPASTRSGLELVEASGVWIDNAVAGPIYVISGQLRNPGSSGVEAPALAVELLDGQGRRVADLPVPLEEPRSRRNLRELAPSELARGRAPGAGRPIEPGASVAFEAVVGPVPSGTASYRVVDAPPSLRRPSRDEPGKAPGERRRGDAAREMIAEREPAPAGESLRDAPPTGGSPASRAP